VNMENRPWGTYEVLLDSEDCKVKRITVNPGQAPSYQSHTKRNELWKIISGFGKVTLDDVHFDVEAEMDVTVLAGQKHRIRNTGDTPLVFVEIQTGTYFGEDDIIRYEDDYNRL
jgi:mannose-6-phosphate isomerase